MLDEGKLVRICNPCVQVGEIEQRAGSFLISIRENRHLVFIYTTAGLQHVFREGVWGSHSKRWWTAFFEEAPSPMAGEPQQLNTRTEAPLWHQGRLALCQNSTFTASEYRTITECGLFSLELGLGHSEKSFLLFGKIKVISSCKNALC
ncbi:hypothetical protein CDAR_207001 [Caerostris darwini]|uniref:Uncharacterized protein n=1 Tax=Caerostris darwini TaxID=1538125 RepID=A0AAV4SU77_9ARAC|nr:hypothetical protein CDAR_207001 [Caerostris darwini]